MKRQIFRCFHLVEGTMNIFENFKVKIAGNRARFPKTFFYKQVLDFFNVVPKFCQTLLYTVLYLPPPPHPRETL